MPPSLCSRVAPQVHRFDPLSSAAASRAAFHPSGLELVSDAGVWDLRTFRLQQFVPTLAGQSPVFCGPETFFAFPTQAFSLDERRRNGASLEQAVFGAWDASLYTKIWTESVGGSVPPGPPATHEERVQLKAGDKKGYGTIWE